jgi:PKD repeat protein
VFNGGSTTIRGVAIIGTTGLASTTTGTCTATSPGTSPDGPGRTTYKCTFGTALAPDINGDTEVEITLTFSDGNTTEVEIGITGTFLVAGFTVAPDFPTIAPTSVTFTSTAVTGSPGYTPVGAITYSWSFGDGTTSALANPNHVYTSPGEYTVSLTVSDSNSPPVTGSVEHAILVFNNFLVVSFTNSPPSPVPGQAVSFASTVTGGNGYPPATPLTYSWNFGDGTACTGTSSSPGTCTGTAASPTHTYGPAGNYQVKVSVTDASGVGGTRVQFVLVAPFTVDFTCTKSSLTVSCTASTTNGNPPFSYSWSFGGAGSGTGLSGPNPMFTYSAPGTYSVKLTVTDNNGNMATMTHTITVP